MEPERLLGVARLARWLGPWTPESVRPRGVVRRWITVPGERSLDAWIYRPRREPDGALLVLPGLHYLGPADPRLDRFLAILADAGTLVLCPFLPDLRALGLAPSVIGDAIRAFDVLSALPDVPRGVVPGVFSVSVGSYPAIHLAGAREIGGLLLFGGYASFEDLIRFSIEGQPGRPHDPLNQPVVFLTLLPHLDGAPADPEPLRRAWVRYVRSTWGRPWMKARAAYEPIARDIAARLPPDSRELFLMGAGLVPGGAERIRDALERARPSLAELDPLPACRAVRAPVTIVHGTDDDVIPHTHAAILRDALPPEANARVILTGLYAHTGHGGADPRLLFREARALVAMLDALVAISRNR